MHNPKKWGNVSSHEAIRSYWDEPAWAMVWVANWIGWKNTFFVASQRNRLHSDRHVLCFCWRLLKVVLTHICIAQHIAQLFTHKIAWFQIPKWGPLCCGYRMLQAWTPLVFTLPGGGEAYSHSPCGIFVTCEVALFMILRACTDAWRTWGAQDKDNTDE